MKWYFPDGKNKYIDRAFTWMIFECLQPTDAQRYYDRVMDSKAVEKPRSEYVGVKLTKGWAEELLKYTPKSK